MTLAIKDLPAMTGQEFQRIAPTALLKSPGNKRVVNDRRVAELARNYDPFLAGTVHVSSRDGLFYTIDGWHRVSAAVLAAVPQINVMVIHGYSEADDARAFDLLNTNRVRISAGDEFWARVDYREPVAISVMNVCSQLGIVVAKGVGGNQSAKPNIVTAYSALQSVAARFGPDVLRRDLAVIRASWPDDGRALEATNILWIGSFLALYESHPDWSSERFAKTLGKIASITLGQRVKAFDAARGNVGRGGESGGVLGKKTARDVLLDIYNRGLRSRQLPEATQSDLKRASLGQNPWVKAIETMA